LDGDGVKDYAVGQNSVAEAPTDLGTIWILLMNADGTVKSEIDILNEGGFGGTIDSFDTFGSSVTSLDDLDGDGTKDIAIGSSGDDDGGGSSIGSVWITFMNSNGTVKTQQKISNTTGNLTGPITTGDQFGQSIATIGDLDGDGIEDLAVGVKVDDDGGLDRGAVYILFLNADGTVKSEQKISNTTGGFGGALDNTDLFGHSIATIGDLDGDGITDVVVGAAGDDDGGTSRGAVYILFLNADGTVKSEQKISNTTGGFGGALADFNFFGFSVANIGDLDSDGLDDLAVGARSDGDGGTNRGAVWILFLNDNGTVKAEQKISDLAGGFGGVLDNSDEFGFSVASISDVVQNGTVNIVAAGNYTVGEVFDDRFSAVITGDCNPDGTITLAPGDNATCTITNTLINTPPIANNTNCK